MPVCERRLAVLIAAALLAPAVASADYKAYARGQEAAEKQDWGAVETAMQEALAGNPTPKVRVKLYGQRFAPYVPHYYLGLAAYKQNDCAGAMRWFGDAAAAAVIAQLTEFKGVADTARGDCSAKLALATPSKPPPTATTAAAPNAAGVTTPAPVKPAATTTPAPPLVPTKPQPGATTATTATPATVPAALQNALQQWLGGRYRNVVSASLAGVQGKALAHLHLLRAASSHALSEIEVANAAAHRSRAEQEIRSARAAQPSIALDAGFYSPRFRAFFSSVR
ncbi:MAG: hypothetical protein IPH76_09650 [Xanthomonadales bacterium]|nr:hypothetical protein [Xanthomonadales bacterium]